MPDDPHSPVYFLVHAPKAAGTTIEEHLQRHLAKERLWMPSPPSTIAMLRGQRYGLDDIPDLRQVRALTGHWIGRSLERHFRGREIRRTLLLRDPIGCHVSFYNYRMMVALSRGRPTCSFDRHLRALPRDLVAIFLLWQWLELPRATLLTTGDERKYELLNEALAGFWFVGAYDDCDRLIAEIAADLEVSPVAQRSNTSLYWQKRVDWQPLRADDLPASTRAAILSRNPIHDALWHSWREAGFEAARVRPRPLTESREGQIGLSAFVRAAIFTRSIVIGELLAEPIWEPAVRAGKARQWPRAALLYRTALQRAPGFPEVWVRYGHALLESGDVAAAVTAYRRALELDSEMAETYLHLGHALKVQGRMDEAREAYVRFERLDPAALQRKCDELVACGWEREAVASFWRSLTEGCGSG